MNIKEINEVIKEIIEVMKEVSKDKIIRVLFGVMAISIVIKWLIE